MIVRVSNCVQWYGHNSDYSVTSIVVYLLVQKYVFENNKSHMPAGSKIVFANGSQDPWRHASKQKSSEECEQFQISDLYVTLSPFPCCIQINYIFIRYIFRCYYMVMKVCFVMPTVPSYLIECENCGHCSDLSGCPQAPSNIEGSFMIQTLAETMLDMIAQGTCEFFNYNFKFHCVTKD